tara:strand:- start:2838 stop:3176 length:339 start_codon:yes stop_codon:yes gene_type:complete
MIEYNWDCRNVDVYKKFSEKENVIYRINWRLTALSTLKDFKGTFYNATVTGDILLSLEDIDDFIELTELNNQVLTVWTKDFLGEELVKEIEESAKNELDKIITPEVVSVVVE